MIFTKQKQYKYVCIITKQSDTKSNPKPKPNYYLTACSSKHSTKHNHNVLRMRRNLYETMFSHRFLLLSVVTVTLHFTNNRSNVTFRIRRVLRYFYSLCCRHCMRKYHYICLNLLL